MTTSAVEIERKYDVGAETSLPDLQGLPGAGAVVQETHELDATYFDTDDLRLRAAATTLRLRRGGSDAGWHLKVPLGGDREELFLTHSDPDDGVPQELQALVRSRTRGAELLPVARLQTTRVVRRVLAEDGTPLVEVADDLVRGRAGDDDPGLVWREWEAELLAGPRGLLDDVQQLLLAAGATPSGSASKVGRVLARHATPAGEPAWWGRRPVSSPKVAAGGVLLAHLGEQVEELVVRDPQVRRDLPDAVHRMRVATRRLRSALSTFRPLLDREQTDPVRDELAWLAGVLGEARDAEVMHARLRGLVAEQDAALVVGPVAERIDAELTRRYREAHDRVLVELEGARYLVLLERLQHLLQDPPLRELARERARDVLPGLVRKADKRLRRALTAAGRASGAERDLLLHEARKDAKRARYAAEAVVQVYGRDARRYAKAVTGLQEVLGEHQDGVVTREALRGLADAAHQAGESAFTYGRLHALEEARGAQAGAGWKDLRDQVSDDRLRFWR